MQFFSSDLLQHHEIRNDRLCMRRSKQMGFKRDSKGKRAVPFETSFGLLRRFVFHVIGIEYTFSRTEMLTVYS